MKHFYEVAVDAPLKALLTYLPPSAAAGASTLARGQAVMVPLGKRQVRGLIMGHSSETSGQFELRPILEVETDWPPPPDYFLKWLEWLAEYYVFPLGQVAALAFPPLKAKARSRSSKKGAVVPLVPAQTAPQLTEEQSECLLSLRSKTDFAVHLLHGVTGSGKTEVYLQLLADVLSRGERGLVLVPEIALTPQLIDRFAARFGPQVAVIHSHLTNREKTDQWWSMVDGEKNILIGARSALFCPIKNLGVIIVDEEHEASFKQDEKLKYHARDSAIMLAKLANIPIVLGSATPSIETWHNALRGKYRLHSMPNRVAARHLPEVSVIDLRAERQSEGRDALPFWLSQPLYRELRATLDRGEQAALFLNRRGVAQLALCGDCGFTYECPNCAISLTLHGKSHLVCHYCDYTHRLDEHCPQCQSSELKPLGLGTELIETDMLRLFPDARLLRADRDEIQSRESLEDFVRAVEGRQIDVLIGTQMIAKGLDFPGLTLVGLVLADVGFNLPDFRSSEKSFQLLTQVSGRAGRHSRNPGRVLIQTYNPTHAAIRFTQAHNFAGFCEEELKFRNELFYPPFSKVALFRLQGAQLQNVELAARRLRSRSEALRASSETYSAIQVLGPAPSPLARLRNKFRHQALVKSPTAQHLRAFSGQLFGDQAWLPSGVKLSLDVDPINML